MVGTDEVLELVVVLALALVAVLVVERDSPARTEPSSRITISAPVTAIIHHTLVVFGPGDLVLI